MKQNRTLVQTFNVYFDRFNPLKTLSFVMVLAIMLGGLTTLKATPFNLSSLPGYGVATSATFDFNEAGGWAGWSVPAGKVVLGAKIISAGDNFSDFAVFRPASPGQVFDHYTYGANEYGWVMQARTGQSNNGVQIEVYYADPLAGYVITQSNQLNYNGAGGYGGWSAPAGDIVSGGGYQFNNAYSSASVSALGEPNSVWPHGTFGPNDQGWVLRGPFNDLPNPGRIYVISFDEISCIPVLSTTKIDATCSNISNGSINLTVTGGVGPFTHVWSPGGATTEDISGLSYGTYTVTTTSSNGCTATATASIVATKNAPIVIAAVTNASCSNASDGSINLSVDGTGSFTYAWSPSGAVTEDLNGISSGTYSVSVTGDGGCTTVKNNLVVSANGTLITVCPDPDNDGFGDPSASITICSINSSNAATGLILDGSFENQAVLQNVPFTLQTNGSKWGASWGGSNWGWSSWTAISGAGPWTGGSIARTEDFAAGWKYAKTGDVFGIIKDNQTMSQTFTATATGNGTLNWFDANRASWREHDWFGRPNTYSVALTDNLGNIQQLGTYTSEVAGGTNYSTPPGGYGCWTLQGKTFWFARTSSEFTLVQGRTYTLSFNSLTVNDDRTTFLDDINISMRTSGSIPSGYVTDCITNCGTNKIANGDFEAGNTGFMTSYTYTADLAGNSELVPENRYSVGANANNYHPQFIGTGRTGNFLIVNGNTTTVKELWAQNVDVIAGREYVFTMYTQNLYTLNAPKFSFNITPNDGVSGSVVIGTSNPLAGRNGWIEVTATYISEFTGSAKLSIIDTDLTKIGNDFGIDDISFIETCPPTCSPNEVISYNPGNQSDNLTPVSADVSNTSEALGTPENSDVATSAANNNFVALGMGGSIVLKFAYPIKNGDGDDIYVVETSFGSPTCARYPEKIRAYASQDNCNWVYLGEGCQNTYFDLQGLRWAQYVKIVDITNPASFSGVVDGYDLDGVVCLHGEELNPVPTALVGGSAQTVVNYAPGLCRNTNPVPPARRIPNNALGAAQNNNTINFVALGFGGSLVVKFDYVIFNNPAATEIKVVETSYGNPSCAAYPERAIVEGSLFENGPWTSFGELCQDGEVEIGNTPVQYIRVTDRSAASSFGGSADGYDVDAIVVINPTCGTLAARAAAEQIVDVVNVPNEEVSSNLYPNPASDMTVLSIEGTTANETWTVSIVDISGRVISTRTFVANEGISEHRISVSELSFGIYQVVATNGSNKIVQKLVH